jgi:hypothetical protein
MKQDSRCTCNVTLKCVHLTIVAVEEQRILNSVIVCVCILALVIRHANSIFSTPYAVTYLALSYFFRIFSKGHDFREKNYET